MEQGIIKINAVSLKLFQFLCWTSLWSKADINYHCLSYFSYTLFFKRQTVNFKYRPNMTCLKLSQSEGFAWQAFLREWTLGFINTHQFKFKVGISLILLQQKSTIMRPQYFGWTHSSIFHPSGVMGVGLPLKVSLAVLHFFNLFLWCVCCSLFISSAKSLGIIYHQYLSPICFTVFVTTTLIIYYTSLPYPHICV